MPKLRVLRGSKQWGKFCLGMNYVFVYCFFFLPDDLTLRFSGVFALFCRSSINFFFFLMSCLCNVGQTDYSVSLQNKTTEPILKRVFVPLKCTVTETLTWLPIVLFLQVIKVYNEDNTSRLIEVQSDITAQDVCQLFVLKNQCIDDHNWTLFEHLSHLGIGKTFVSFKNTK